MNSLSVVQGDLMAGELVATHDARALTTPEEGVEYVRLFQKAVATARALGKDRAVVNKYAEQLVRHVRETGRLIERLPRRRGKRSDVQPGPTDWLRFVKESEVSQSTAKNWQSLARLPEKQFEAKLAELIASDDPDTLVSVGPFYDLVHFLRKESDRIARRAKATKLGQLAHPDIHLKDFCDRDTWSVIEDESVALVFTDPPYDRESLPLYDDLAEFANRKLMRGGSLITYLGDYALPEVMQKLRVQDLHFVWPLVCIHSGTAKTLQWGRQNGIKVTSKLMLWFVKGETERITSDIVETAIESVPNKDTHDWQQSLVEATYLIERLAPEGSLVVDPFCGGATTYIAARQLRRNCIAFEKDAKAYEGAITRAVEYGY